MRGPAATSKEGLLQKNAACLAAALDKGFSCPLLLQTATRKVLLPHLILLCFVEVCNAALHCSDGLKGHQLHLTHTERQLLQDSGGGAQPAHTHVLLA